MRALRETREVEGGGAAGVASIEAPLLRAASERSPGFVLAQSDEGWKLDLFGFLPVDWCGNLSLHCCASGVGILQGRAARVSAGRWAARLVLAVNEPEVAIGALDFLRMARHRPGLSGRGASLEIFAVSCKRCEEPEGALQVTVSGRDRLGFLAELLRRFSLFGLYPHELCLRTRGDVADDEFRLCGIGGLPASDRAAALVERELEAYRVSPPA